MTTRTHSSAIHADPHPLAGQIVTLDSNAADPVRGMVMPGEQFHIEDWWDRVSGKSWMLSHNNPAAVQFAMRTGIRCGMEDGVIPTDDEVLYGHIGGIGHLIHVCELPAEVQPA